MKSIKIISFFIKKKECCDEHNFIFHFITYFVLIIMFCLSFVSVPFAKNFIHSLQKTIETIKPTEELFNDSGAVKLVSVLFPMSSIEVSSQIANFSLNIDDYENCKNDNGVLTFENANGLIYAGESGVVHIKEIDDENDELVIQHGMGIESVFCGKFNLGVSDGQYVSKGEPLCMIAGEDLQFYISFNNLIFTDLEYVNGEFVWKN